MTNKAKYCACGKRATFICKFLSVLLALALCSVLVSCDDGEENRFMEVYVEFVPEESNINSVKRMKSYKDGMGGEVVEFTADVKSESGYFIEKEYYLVMSDITLDGNQITLESDWDELLYGDTIKRLNGDMVSKGYFVERSSLDSPNYTDEYSILMTWCAVQAEEDSDVSYDLEKINKVITRDE